MKLVKRRYNVGDILYHKKTIRHYIIQDIGEIGGMPVYCFYILDLSPYKTVEVAITSVDIDADYTMVA